MLSAYVGEEKFKKGIKKYLTDFSLKNATYLDFFDSIEKASEEKLAAFRDSWLLQRGYPIIRHSGEWHAETTTYHLKITQSPNQPPVKGDGVFDFKLPVAFHRKSAPSYDKTLVAQIKTPTYLEKIVLPAEPEWISVNPQSVVLAKIVPEKREPITLALQAIQDPEPIARVWATFELLSDLHAGKESPAIALSTVSKVLTSDPSPYVRNAILENFKTMKTRWLPESLAETIWNLTIESEPAQELASPSPQAIPPRLLASQMNRDPHGWRQFRSKLLLTLGRINRTEVLPYLESALARKDLGLDDIIEAGRATAKLGNPRSSEILKRAFTLHQARGYRFQFELQMAFGALESPLAAAEIREISKTAGSDLMGRIGWLIRDNETLKTSSEWIDFLKEFVLAKNQFSEEVKVRLLETIEEVKTPGVKALLENLVKNGASHDRIKDNAKKTLAKNFVL